MKTALKRKTVFISALLMLAPMMMSQSAMAKDNNSDATKAFEEGSRLFSNGEYEAAAIQFRKANELRESWKLQYNIGQCEAASKHYGLALDAFERYLSGGGDDISADRQKYVLDEISRLRKMVGYLVIDGEKGDEVFVNSVLRTTLPQKSKLRVGMGEVHVQVKRGTDIVYDNTIDVPGGEDSRIKVASDTPAEAAVAAAEPLATPEQGELENDEAVVEPEAPDAQVAEMPSKKRVKRRWTWVALGAGGASGIAAAIVGSVALSKRNAFIDDCEDGSCTRSKSQDRTKINNLALTTDILFSVAGAAVVTGVILFFLEPRFGKDRNDPDSLQIGLLKDGQLISGRF